MKVAFALPFLQRGFGIENRTSELARRLPEGIETALLCLRQSAPAPDMRVVRLAGDGRIAGLLVAAVNESPALFRVTRERFRRFLGPDWIVDAQYHPMTDLRPKGRSIITWYSVPPSVYASSGDEAMRWQRTRQAMLNAIRRADLTICISRAVEGELHREIGVSLPTAVLPIGVTPPLTDIGFPRERHQVLSVGRFAPHKSHEDTILAFRTARQELQDPDLRLVIIGTLAGGGEYLRSLRALAASVGLVEGREIHFVTNATDRMLDLALSGSDLFVSASRWEGFGMPLVEAQARGVPAIAYDLWSHPEVVASPAHLAPEGDVLGLADKMVYLLGEQDRWRKASSEARAFVEAHFNWDIIGRRYVDLLRGL